MANITLSGTLLDPNSGFAARDKIRFTHKTTTGSTLKGSVSTLVIGADGAYSIDLQYGLVLVERRDSTKSQYINLGVVTVNADNPATTLPELLSASVPVSSEQLIEFQSILADCLAAQAAAEAAAAEAVSAASQLGSNTGASLVGTSSGATVQQSLDALTDGQTGGVIVFATYALLDAYTPQNATEEKSSFKVTNDPDSSKNGYYSWVSGTTYTKDADITEVRAHPNYTDLPAVGETGISYIVTNDTDSAVNGDYFWNGTGYSKGETLELSTVKLIPVDKRLAYNGYGNPEAEGESFTYDITGKPQIRISGRGTENDNFSFFTVIFYNTMYGTKYAPTDFKPVGGLNYYALDSVHDVPVGANFVSITVSVPSKGFDASKTLVVEAGTFNSHVTIGNDAITDKNGLLKIKHDLFVDKIEDTLNRSNNLIDNATFVDFRTDYNSVRFHSDGKSAIIAVDDSKDYWLIRPTLPLSGIFTNDQFQGIAASFTDGDNGTGNFIAADSSNIIAFLNCVGSGKIIIPTGAKSLILTVETPNLGFLEGISFSEATANSNFTFDTDAYYSTKDQTLEQVPIEITLDQRVGTKGILNFDKVSRTQRIYVQNKSLLWIKAGITPTLFGTIAALYDADGEIIEEINITNGNVSNNSDNAIVNAIIENDFIYLNLRTDGVTSVSVASFANGAEYVYPEIMGKIINQPNEINNHSVLWANPIIVGSGGERVYHQFFCKSKSGKILKHTVTTQNITSNIFGFGSEIVTNPIVEENFADKTVLINAPNIAEYYSMRTKVGDVQDADWIGHGDTMNLLNIKYIGDGVEIDPVAAPKDLRRFETVEIVQELELIGNYNSTLIKIADAELRFIINADGSYRYTNKLNYVVDLEVTTMYVAMQLFRSSAKSDTVVAFDKLAYKNDSILQDVQMGLPRENYISDDRSLVLIDSIKNIRVEIDMQAWENNHPSILNDKLSFQSETSFAKLYYYFGLGERIIGDNYLTDVTLKYY